ncbi:MAG: response regulator [Rhodospirillaceae bacterium]
MTSNQDLAWTVAIVDDDPGLRDSICSLLATRGMASRQYESAETFLADPAAFDSLGCLLVDQHFPGMSGIDLLRRLSADGRLPPAILFSASLNERMVIEARMAGALAVLDKPVGPAALLSQLSTALSFATPVAC